MVHPFSLSLTHTYTHNVYNGEERTLFHVLDGVKKRDVAVSGPRGPFALATLLQAGDSSGSYVLIDRFRKLFFAVLGALIRPNDREHNAVIHGIHKRSNT